MSNYAIMRCKKIKSMVALKGALAHDRRERIPKNANPDMALKSRFRELSTKNIDNYSQVFENARKNAVYAVEWVFTASDMTEIIQKNFANWVQDNINFIGDKMGGQQNILSCSLHYDEKTPHLHIIAIPVKDNKLNCRFFLGGNKYKMRDLQNEYYDIVKKYNLDRGVSKEITHRYNNKPSLAKANMELEKIQNKYNTLEEECKKKIKRNNDLRQKLLSYGFSENELGKLLT